MADGAYGAFVSGAPHIRPFAMGRPLDADQRPDRTFVLAGIRESSSGEVIKKTPGMRAVGDTRTPLRPAERIKVKAETDLSGREP
jgi:hypothetical protein